MKPPIPTLLLCLAGAAAGAGLGWLLRGIAAGRGSTAEASGAATGGTASVSSARLPATLKRAPDPAADDLTAELGRQAGAMRWLYLLGAADKATAADMPGLLRAARELPGATRMLALRWAELDPHHMFVTLRAEHARHPEGGGLVNDYFVRSILFETWAKRDPEAAIAALEDRSALPGVESERMSLANTIMKSDPARGIKLMTDWNITSFLPDLAGIDNWATQNPRAAAEAALGSNIGHATDDVMKRIGKAWAASDPAGAIVFATGRRGLGSIQLAQAVMSAWAQQDLGAAIEHVTTEPETLTKAKLGLPLIEAWARSDPEAALVWANENLKGEARAYAAASVVKTMAAQDINGAASFIAGLDPGGGKDRAINQFVETCLGNDWLNNRNSAKATEVLTWLASLPEPEARTQAMEQASWRLFHGAPEETLAFLNSPQGATAPQRLFDQAARHLARQNPDTAMQWATALPPDRRVDAQTSVLTEWVSTRPEAAMDWTRALPRSETRTHNVGVLTSQLAWQSFELARPWIESLPAADRPAALAGLQTTGPALTPEKRTALEALLK